MNGKTNTKEHVCTLNSCLFFSNAKLSRAFGKIADEAFSKTGLSPSHALLLYLVNLNGGMMQKELGETLHLTPSTITRLIEKLEHKGLVSKQSEGKQVYLNTTSEGLYLQDKIMESWDLLHKEYEGVLTEEETAHFIEISGKLLKHLENN
ncbi:MarR family winged helix-turn-helix transcriptional regulator [Lacrimispora sp. JR3]|uniref:MarR family winged helix-turn-helix transcriptional regulator n=1 Tax=Lacrimispora sinapis TaxID=3111456 RepID=UPI003748F450